MRETELQWLKEHAAPFIFPVPPTEDAIFVGF